MAKEHSALTRSTGQSFFRRPAAAVAASAAAALVAVAVALLLPGESSGTSHAQLAGASASTPPASAITRVPATDMTTPAAPFTTNASFFPPGNGPGVVTVSRSQAITAAQSTAVDSTGMPLSPEAREALPTFARLMSYSMATQLTRTWPDPRIDPNRQVWMVTVLGYHLVDLYPGEKASPVADKYTIVLDATSGFGILGMFGTAVLTSD